MYFFLHTDFTIKNRRCRPHKTDFLSQITTILRCSLVEWLSPKQGASRLFWLMQVFAFVAFVPSCSIGTTLNFPNLSSSSSGHSFSSYVASFPISLFLPVLHVLGLLQRGSEEQNSQVWKMHCKRGEKDELPPRQAGWTSIILSWLAAVKIPL